MVQLSQEQIEKNKAIFLKTNETYKILPQGLLDFLGDSFFRAPASTMTSIYNACDGGLVDHILQTAKLAKKINELYPATLQQPTMSVMRASFLFDIGKTFLYVPNSNEWSVKNGKIYDYAQGMAAMRVGERSALYALQHMSLTEEEYQAIVYSDKDELDAQVKWYGSPLTTILRQAIEISIMELKSRR